MIGLYLWMALIVVEISLFYMTFKANRFRYRLNRNASILSIALIIMMMTSGIITWSFRYYGLLIVLLIMGIMNHKNSLRSSDELKPYTYKLSGVKTIFRGVILTAMMIPSMIFPEYKPVETSGRYTVQTTQLTIVDNQRIETFSNQNDFRTLNVLVYYPENVDALLPLVVYSHGGISLTTSNDSLFLELASHGYVVFSIGHPYHTIVTKSTEGKNIWINSTYMQELSRENATENPEESFVLYQQWMQLRSDDINSVINYTKAQVEKHDNPFIFSIIDIENIALAGHSLGGSAALCVGRENADIQAIIALESPYMCDILGVADGQFIIDESAYPKPVLNIYSDSTWDRLSILPQYKQNNLMLENNESTVVNRYIDGTGHFSLTDLSLTSPIITRILNGFPAKRKAKEVLQIINEETLEFLDIYLKK